MSYRYDDAVVELAEAYAASRDAWDAFSQEHSLANPAWDDPIALRERAAYDKLRALLAAGPDASGDVKRDDDAT